MKLIKENEKKIRNLEIQVKKNAKFNLGMSVLNASHS